MSDPLDDALAAFDATLGIEPQAEPAAPDEGGTAEPEAAEQPERLRDEQGRFAPKDTPEPEAQEGEPEQELILGRFKTHEELAKAYDELDREFGRRNQEWGELRKELAELRDAVQPRQEPYRAPANLAELIDENPAQATMLAYDAARQGDPQAQYLLRQAAAAWEELAPGAPALWAENQKLREEFTQFRSSMEERISPVQEQAFRNDFGTAWAQVKNQYPDLEKYGEQIVTLAQTNPEWASRLATGSLDDKKQLLGTLYKVAAFDATRENETLLTAAHQEAATQQEQEARAEKDQAFVAASTQRNDPVARTADDDFFEMFDKAAARYYGDE